MKILFLLLALLFTQQIFAISTGAPLKDGKLLGHKGEVINPASFSDQIVVLEWFNEGCPFVKKHYNTMNMQKLQKRHAKNVVWLTITSSSKDNQGYIRDATEAMNIYNRQSMASKYLLMDPTGVYGQHYGAMTTPHMFVFNKGKLVYQGAIDNKPTAEMDDVKTATNYIDKVIEAIKTGKKVPKGSTRPYGCSVKY